MANNSWNASNALVGPAFAKLLVTNTVAGSIIGRSGSEVVNIERETGCTIRLSCSESYYPGTNRRCCAVSGKIESIAGAINMILVKVKNSSTTLAPSPTSKFTSAKDDAHMQHQAIATMDTNSGSATTPVPQTLHAANYETQSVFNHSSIPPSDMEMNPEMQSKQNNGCTDNTILSTEFDSSNEFADSSNIAKKLVGEPGMLSHFNNSESGKIECVLIVPRSAVSCIIGRGGQIVQQIMESTRSKVVVSDRESGLAERLVTVMGSFDATLSAIMTIIKEIQVDKQLKEYCMLLDYKPQGFKRDRYSNIVMPNQSISSPIQSPATPLVPAPPIPQLPAPSLDDRSTYPGVRQSILNSECEIQFQVPDSAIGAIIGKQGCCLSEVKRLSGARVMISQKGELVPGTANRQITLSGSLPALHYAHALLWQQYLVSAAQELEAEQAQRLNVLLPPFTAYNYTPNFGTLDDRGMKRHRPSDLVPPNPSASLSVSSASPMSTTYSKPAGLHLI